MPDTRWTERYAGKTLEGCPWRSISPFAARITGEVYKPDGWRVVTWTVWPLDGSLFCAENRGNNIACLDSQVGLMVTTPARALDSAPFVVHATRNARVTYSFSLVTQLLAVGTDEATVAVLIDGVEVDRLTNKVSLGVGLSINDQRTQIKSFTHTVLAGQTVQLVTLASSSSAPAPSINTQREVIE